VKVGLALREVGGVSSASQVDVGVHLCNLASERSRAVELAAAVELGCDPSAQDYDGRTVSLRRFC
jgi:hypothetical protein